MTRVPTGGGSTGPRRPVVEPSRTDCSTLIEIDGDRVGVSCDRHPRLPCRNFYLEECT